MEISSSLCCRRERVAKNLATGPGAAADESPALLSVYGALKGVAISIQIMFLKNHTVTFHFMKGSLALVF